MNRSAALLLLPLCLLGAGLQARAAPLLLDTSGQRIAFDAYHLCAQLHLPDNFATITDLHQVATDAANRCPEEALTLAGQFALENPGTNQTQEFLAGQKRLVATRLVEWIRGLRPQRAAASR